MKANQDRTGRRRTSKSLVAVLLATTMLAAPLAGTVPTLAKQPAEISTKLPGSFADLVANARPAVVSVIVKKTTGSAMAGGLRVPEQELPDGLKEIFKRFGLPNEGPGSFGLPQFRGKPAPEHRGQRVMGQGSGFFITEDGYIVTNNHVVKGADSIEIRMHDGKTLKARLVGTDPKTDLAVIKVEGRGFTKVEFGDSSKTRVGDWVIAVGNPFGLAGTATAGIVSARGRDIGSGPYDDFIQIDAPINRGNSGGPTFNEKGEVVGVNTAIYSPSGGSVGIGFAIPSNIAKKVVASLIKDGTVHRGWLGVTIQGVSEDIAASLGLDKKEGALIASVKKNSPADKAGLQTGDVVLKVNATVVKSPRELSRIIAGKPAGSRVALTLWRDGHKISTDVSLAQLPGSKLALTDLKGARGKARLGLMLKDSDKGVVIAQVVAGSPAADKGLRPGDVIAKVDGTEVKTAQEVVKAVKDSRNKGKSRVLMLLKTKDGNRFVALKLGKSIG